MAKNYTKTKLIRTDEFGTRRSDKAIIASLVLVGLLIVAVGIRSVLSFNEVASDNKDSITRDNAYLQSLTDIDFFIREYTNANGGQELFDSILTARITGKIIEERGERRLSLTKKRPNLMRMKLIGRDYEMTIGVNEELVWQRVQAANMKPQFLELEGEDKQIYLANSRLLDPILDSQTGHGEIQSIEIVDRESMQLVKINLLTNENQATAYLVDPKTLHIKYRLYTKNEADNVVEFGDYRPINGLPVAFHSKTFADGVLQRELLLHTVEFNIGVLSDYFKTPGELTPKLD